MRRRQVSRTQTTSLARRFATVTSKKYFLPTSIAGCQLWLDASDSSSIIKTGTNVTAWRDKSGNGYHMDTITPNASWSGTAAYPTIGTPINGLQTLNFSSQAGLKQSLTLDGVKNLFWIGRIAAPTGTAAGGAPIYFLLGHDSNYDWHGSYYGQRFIDGSNSQGGIYGATASLFTSDANAVTNATFGLMNLPSAPSISLLSVTGITGTTRYQGICYDRTTHTGWCGDLAEVIIFSTALTTAQRQAVEGYLAHKWGLTSYYSPVTPLTIPGCSIWLDSSDTSSFTLSGSTVTTWKDKSGNGNNFSSVIGSTSVTSDNGMNVVNFSSNDAVMSSANNVPLTSSSAIFVVSKLLSINASTFGYILALPDILGWDDYSFRYRSGDALIGTRAFPGGDDGNIGNANYYVNGEFDPIRTGQFLNKYSVISTIKPTRTGTTKVLLSSSSSGRYFKGYIAEFLYYSGGVSLSQRETIEKYLMQKWGLGIIPSTHPYVNFIPAPPSLFIPPLIAEGCVLWLDGADPAGTGVKPANGATISPWVDKATGKNGTASGTSTYITGGGVNFTGSSYFINQNFAHNLSQRSIFIVMEERRRIIVAGIFSILPNSTSVTAFPGNDYSNPSGLSVETGSGMNFNGNVMNGGSYSSALGNPTLLVKAIYNDNMNVRAGSGFLNGTNATNITAGYTAETGVGYTVSGRWQGGSVSPGLNLDGIIYEILYFNKALSAGERTQVEGYLAWKWSLNTSLPSTHLYKSLNPSDLVSTNNFLPTLISGCQLWLDAADKTSMTLSGSNVTAWTDKSPLATPFTLSNGSGGSTIRTTYAGLPVVQVSNSCFFNASYSYPLATRSIFFVMAETVHSDWRGLLSFANTVGQSDYNTQNGYTITSTNTVGANVQFSQNGGNGGFAFNYNANNGVKDVPFQLYEDVTSNTAVTLFVTGSNIYSSNTSVAPLTSTGLTVGGRGGIPNTGALVIAEVLIYNKALSTTERQQVESYLAWKWGLQASLPSDHTYKSAPPSV